MSKKRRLNDKSLTYGPDNTDTGVSPPKIKRQLKDGDGSRSASSSQESSSGEEKNAVSYLSGKGQYSDFASRMMAKMGYKAGKGLGPKQQGIVEPVEASNQRGRRGIGLKIQAIEKEVIVDWEDEKLPSSIEHVDWMPRCNEPLPEYEELREWSVEGKKKLTLDDEDLFCDEELLKTMLSCKTVFDDLEGAELRNARTRSNPYENIRGAIFLNRAAMKMANMDHALQYLFTAPKDLGPNEILYFADVCAGPGGFSEYVLWRKKWRSKGFGFTLKGKNDFKLTNFFAADPELFEPHYGVGGINGDGDIMNTDNMEEFQDFVLENTQGKGVHFIMADGGFSVEGQENIQEILSKQLLLCQCACALSIVRVGGTFLCKTFDLFTPFSVSLVYLLRRAFEDVTVFKPVTSRPANSERYLVCKGYRDSDRLIAEYLFSVNQDMNEKKNSDRDITSVVPLDTLLEDDEFCTYMKDSNEAIAKAQCKALAKLHAYAKDRNLKETTQAQVRKECLEKWGIPDRVRAAPANLNVRECYEKYTEGIHNLLEIVRESEPLTKENLEKLSRIYDYRCFLCAGRRAIIVSLGGARIFEWNYESRRWIPSPSLNCHIPRNTILEVEFVQEMKGEGKGQRKIAAVHVVDAIVLSGQDISTKHYTERTNDIQMFVTAISKITLPNVNMIRAKTVYRTEAIREVFDSLSLKQIKGYGVQPRVCCSIAGTEKFFVPTGLCFTKITKDPWTMAFSKSRNRKYFFNTTTRESSFECPPDFCATYEMCATNRLSWSWGYGVKVHDDQKQVSSDNLSKDDIIQFMMKHPI